jgi:hypothetical protein
MTQDDKDLIERLNQTQAVNHAFNSRPLHEYITAQYKNICCYALLPKHILCHYKENHQIILLSCLVLDFQDRRGGLNSILGTKVGSAVIATLPL